MNNFDYFETLDFLHFEVNVKITSILVTLVNKSCLDSNGSMLDLDGAINYLTRELLV